MLSIVILDCWPGDLNVIGSILPAHVCLAQCFCKLCVLFRCLVSFASAHLRVKLCLTTVCTNL